MLEDQTLRKESQISLTVPNKQTNKQAYTPKFLRTDEVPVAKYQTMTVDAWSESCSPNQWLTLY